MSARRLTVLRGKVNWVRRGAGKDHSSSLFLNGQWLKRWGFNAGDIVSVNQRADGVIEIIRAEKPVAPGFKQAMQAPRLVTGIFVQPD